MLTPTELISIITKDQLVREQRENCRIATSFYDGNPIGNLESSHKNLSAENSKFVWSQMYLEILLRLDREGLSKSRQETIKLCRERHKNNPKQLDSINDFEKSYKRKEALKWYTRATYLYEPLNKALRQNDLESLFVYRFFLHHINRHLSALHRQFTDPIVHVYRGQVLHSDEIERMKQCQGQIISMNSLFSTSGDPDVASAFALSLITGNVIDHQYQAVLFDIQANTQYSDDESRPFADISHFSQFPEEKEVLFMAGCVFRLNSVTYSEEQQLWTIKLTLCSQNEHELAEFYVWLRHCISSQVNLFSLCHLLRDMGQLDQAERLHHYELMNSEERGKRPAFIALGQIAQLKNDNARALTYYEKALNNLDESVDRETRGIIHNYLGDVHFNLGNFELALVLQQEALEYFLKSVGEKHLDTANVYESLGRVYYMQKIYDLALECLQKCLRIRQMFLPKSHPKLAQIHFHLGKTYQSTDQLKLALESYQTALTIQRNAHGSDHSNVIQTEEAIKSIVDRQEIHLYS